MIDYQAKEPKKNFKGSFIEGKQKEKCILGRKDK
jgi:hypothetical protein